MEVGYFSGSNYGTALWDESLSPKKFIRSVSIVHHTSSTLFTCCASRQLHGAIGPQSSGRCCDARRGGAATGVETHRVGLLNPWLWFMWFVICVVIHVIHVLIIYYNPAFFGALCMFERLWLLYPWVPCHFCFPWRRNSFALHFWSEIVSLRRNPRRCWEWQMMALTMKQRKSWSKAGKFAVWPSMQGIRILQQLWKQPTVLRLKLYGSKNYIWLTESQRPNGGCVFFYNYIQRL